MTGLSLIFALLMGLLGAYQATAQDRHPFLWFVICFIFPLIGNLVLLILASVAASRPPAPPEATKTCPQCAETIKAAAKICRYCRYEFSEEELKAIETEAAPSENAAEIADRMIRRNLHGE